MARSPPFSVEGHIRMSHSRFRAASDALPLLVVMYGAAFVAAYNEYIVNIALIDIIWEFSAGATTAHWLITGYMLLSVVITAPMAFLSRRLSTKRLFFVPSDSSWRERSSAWRYRASGCSLVCRIIQAVGLGMLFPLKMNVVLVKAPRQRLGLFLSIGGACVTLGPAFAPVVSAFMVALFGWRAIFVLPAVAMAVLAIAGVKVVQNVSEASEATLDAPSLAGITCFVYGLSELSSAPVVACCLLVVTALVVVLFVRRQNRICRRVRFRGRCATQVRF